MTVANDDFLAEFKQAVRSASAAYAPNEVFNMAPASRLVDFARVRAQQRVLDVACGTGVVAITAAVRGATVTGLDLTPELLARARENMLAAEVIVEWREGDAESLPFADESFDVVLSQFGHLFAPRADAVAGEMLRVLAPGGTIAFSTWPREALVGRFFALIEKHLPPPPHGISAPIDWGDPPVVRARLGDAVRDLTFDRASVLSAAFNAAHYRAFCEQTIPPVRRVVRALEGDPVTLAALRRELHALIDEYLRENCVRADYLMSRAVKL